MKTFLIAVGMLFLIQGAQAQTKIDVKTRVNNKKQLLQMKASVEAHLSQSLNYTVGDIGEDYSYWIMSSYNYEYGDSVFTTTKYELRTAAMFSRGDLVRKGAIVTRHVKDISRSTVSYSMLAQKMEKEIRKYLFLADLSYNSTRTASFGSGLTKAFKNLSKASQRETGLEPTKTELVENTLVGIKTVQELNTIFGY